MKQLKEPDIDEVIKSFLWQLGLAEFGEVECHETWGKIKTYEKYGKTVNDIGQIIGKEIQIGLTTSLSSNFKRNDSFFVWDAFRVAVKRNPSLKKMLEEKVKECIRQNLGVPPKSSYPNTIAFGKIEATVSLSNTDTQQQQGSGIKASPKWNDLPIPDGPENHTEFDTKECQSGDAFQIIGARVRGKKHKHEATNCDDWFEFDVSGDWTIIAVSDGAGSRKLSRIGSKTSCQAAVKYLKEKLTGHKLAERDQWTGQDFARDSNNGVFGQADIEFIQSSLHEAMEVAYQATVKAAEDRTTNNEYESQLQRKLEVNDLSATLLLAVSIPAKQGQEDRNLIMTCQIGDGMIGAIRQDGMLQILGLADSGEFSGETEFLTSFPKVKTNLWHKTFGFFGPLQALMAMTDGVSDDYFPNDPGLIRLYSDLVINGIIQLPNSLKSKITESLASTSLSIQTLEALEQNENFRYTVTKLGEEIVIRHAGKLAKEYGIEEEQLVLRPELLLAGASGKPLCQQGNASERLKVWLDSYEVRGSFDDRTLVVMYHKEV